MVRNPNRPGAVLAVACCAQLILAVDLTIVNVANPRIERALGFTAGNLQWTITSYSLAFGGFLLLGGRLADLVGRQRMFIIGISGFALSSLSAGLSRNLVELIVARLVQGLCAALISPTALALLASTYPEGRARQRAYGVWASFGSVGGLTGFFIGGVVTTYLGWRWIFFMNVPIAAAAIIGAVIYIGGRETETTRQRRLDLPGAVSVTFAIALVIFGLGEGPSTGWTADGTLIALALAPVVLLLFIAVERHSTAALVPFFLFRRRAAIAYLLAVIQQSLGAATSFLAPLFLQQVWGYSPLRAGSGALPLPIGFVIGARLSSRLVARLGAQRLVVAGFAFVCGGLFWLSQLPSQGDYLLGFCPALFVRSFGQGLLIVPIVVTATSGVENRNQGIAAGLFNTSQQLGGSLGLAAVATVVATAANADAGRLAGVAHGFHLGFLVSAAIAFVGGLAAFIGLRYANSIRGRGQPMAEADETAILQLEGAPTP